jgi:hypothetical protein
VQGSLTRPGSAGFDTRGHHFARSKHKMP